MRGSAALGRAAPNSRTGRPHLPLAWSEKSLEIRRIDGFRAVVVEARRQGATLVVSLTPTGQRNQFHFLSPRLAPDALRQLITAQVRHADIEHSDFRAHAVGDLQRLGTRVCQMNLVAR